MDLCQKFKWIILNTTAIQILVHFFIIIISLCLNSSKHTLVLENLLLFAESKLICWLQKHMCDKVHLDV